MQKVLGYMRKAIQEFDLIEDGDRIAVGISGGKDSLILLKGLHMLKRFIGIEYDIVAITLDPRFNGVDGNYESVQEMCDEMGIEYVVYPSDIGEIVFTHRKEKSPCSLCARMRRGALHDQSKLKNCNKLALGHHYNDVVETFVMNLFNEGRVGCFSPKSYLSRKDITVIRPLVFAPEKDIKSAVRRTQIEVVKSKCPVDGVTNRQRTKEFLQERDKLDSGFTYRLFGALRRSGVDGWAYKNSDKNEQAETLKLENLL